MIKNDLVAKESILHNSILFTVYFVTAVGRLHFACYGLWSPTWDPFLYHGFNQNSCVLNSKHHHVNRLLQHDLFMC